MTTHMCPITVRVQWERCRGLHAWPQDPITGDILPLLRRARKREIRYAILCWLAEELLEEPRSYAPELEGRCGSCLLDDGCCVLFKCGDLSARGVLSIQIQNILSDDVPHM